MSVADFRRIASEARPMTKQICLHLMGEPMAHPNFSEIMDICDELQLKIFLTSNGTLLKKHHEKLLKWKALEQINFSIHSFFANPEKVALTEYLKPILAFCDEATREKTDFYINLRLWNLEKTDQQKHQNLEVFGIINEHFGLLLNERINVTLNKSKKIIGKLYLHFDTEFIWPDLKQEIRSESGTCYGLRKQLAIHANGDVVPCCLDKETALKLGNSNNSTLKEIISSKRAKDIKSGFEKGKLIEALCQRCQYVDRFKAKSSKNEFI